jgi:hypothetical protein
MINKTISPINNKNISCKGNAAVTPKQEAVVAK